MRLLLLTSLLLPAAASADPCGMVPPMRLPPTVTSYKDVIQRTGAQVTYVSHAQGIETMLLRPGFSGKVDEFGMLIPFPSPPAIRKTADDAFPQIAAAVDPPIVSVDLNPRRQFMRVASTMKSSRVMKESSTKKLEFDSVRVVNQEAVGMYEVAVLEAGSSAALDRWMSEHGFKYPDGMDGVVDDYVDDRWFFVAIKTRVGQMPGVTPKPGMRKTNHSLPPGSSFDGHVQGMGFRFKTDELVVPMRLSTFNGPSARNVVYVLSERPLQATGMSSDLVKRQLSGSDLYSNLTDLLDLNVIGGTEKDIDPTWLDSIRTQRDPTRYNGVAKDLFAGDLLAMSTGELLLPHETTEKELLNISEQLGLRGPGVDGLMSKAVSTQKDATAERALPDLRKMTLTVLDGDMPRDLLASENVSFQPWAMPSKRNSVANYNATALFGPKQSPYLYGQRRASR